jgi:hypothetical protein
LEGTQETGFALTQIKTVADKALLKKNTGTFVLRWDPLALLIL